MIKAEDFKWLDRVYHLFHLGSYLCLSGALTDCFLPFFRASLYVRYGIDNRRKTSYSNMDCCGTNSSGHHCMSGMVLTAGERLATPMWNH